MAENIKALQEVRRQSAFDKESRAKEISSLRKQKGDLERELAGSVSEARAAAEAARTADAEREEAAAATALKVADLEAELKQSKANGKSLIDSAAAQHTQAGARLAAAEARLAYAEEYVEERKAEIEEAVRAAEKAAAAASIAEALSREETAKSEHLVRHQ